MLLNICCKNLNPNLKCETNDVKNDTYVKTVK